MTQSVVTPHGHNGTMNAHLCPNGHKECASSKVEDFARDVVMELLNDGQLDRVCQRSRDPKPDFRSRGHAIEVKQLISQPLRSYQAAHGRHLGYGQHYPVDSLRNNWGVLPDLSPAIDSFVDVETPRVKYLVRRLTPLIKCLEANGITDASTDHRYWPHFVAILGELGHCSVVPGGPIPRGILV